MEYCDSGDLSGLLRRKRRLEENLAKLYIAEILLAIQELHKHNIIFRDLKPENVILSKDGHARLTDFGLSREGVKYN